MALSPKTRIQDPNGGILKTYFNIGHINRSGFQIKSQRNHACLKLINQFALLVDYSGFHLQSLLNDELT